MYREIVCLSVHQPPSRFYQNFLDRVILEDNSFQKKAEKY
ncbi:hypothetical protein M595_3564 [Lyngbya aestuarii BL J]|uniref:Uncharacterized protein n=1 Tax=Lyngbya aestuarii BL J TaxID=1348334 RepID=U7QJ86_9CYAN|nr:hypothetical protein M595_3564 [Lyngbya aestuarii BL J]